MATEQKEITALARRIAVTYTHDSDTLFVHFDGQARPSVSIAASQNVYVLVDIVNREIVGVQVENICRGWSDAPR